MPHVQPSVALLSIQRPLFRGDKEGAWRRSIDEIGPLCEGEGLAVHTYGPTIEDGATAVRAAAWLDETKPSLALVQLTTFATGEMLLPLAEADVRLGLWAIEETWREGPLPLNSLCGLNMYLSILGRSPHAVDRPCKWFYGYPSDPFFEGRFRVTAGALRAAARVEGARVGLIGGVAPAFYGLEADLAQVSKRFGAAFEEVSLDEFFQRAESVGEGELDTIAAAMEADATQCLAAPEQLRKSARIEAALRATITERGLDAAALRCWPEIPERLGAMPCASVGRVMGDQAPVACEGDPLGALAMLALEGMSRERPMMMDMSDWDRDDGTVLMWHCGNTPKEWADRRGDTLTPHFNRTDAGTVRQLVFREGPATVLRLLGDGEEALVCAGRFCKPDKPSFAGARGWMTGFRMGAEKLDALTFVNTILERSLPHHFPMAQGDWEAAAREFAAWRRVKLVEPVDYSEGLSPE